MVAEPTTAIARRRRPRSQYAKRAEQSTELVERKLPEYLEAHEVQAIIRAVDDPRARFLMMEQWRAGLRVSEALALEVADLSLDAELPRTVAHTHLALRGATSRLQFKGSCPIQKCQREASSSRHAPPIGPTLVACRYKTVSSDARVFSPVCLAFRVR